MREDWKEEELIKVSEFIDYRGRTPKKTESGIKLITAKNVRMGYLKNDPEEFIAESAYDDWMTRGIPQKGDVLFTTEAPLANVALLDTDEKIALAQRIITICPDREILNGEYLTYCIQSPEMQYKILEKGTGATVTGIKSRVLKKVKIPIPPLPEQQRIVAILDEAFEAIDQAKANVERNIQNAEELFNSCLVDILTEGGENWENKSLGEVCKIERGSSPRPIKKFYTEEEQGVNWVKIGDVGEKDKYVTSTKYKITPEGSEKSRFVDVGDFIVSNSMSYGRPYIMAIPGYIHDGWFVLRLPDNLDSDFFWQLLASPLLKEQFETLAAGAIVKNISSDLIKKAELPIPPLTKQKEIVSKTENLNASVQPLIELYQKKLNDIEELKKTILQKAFSGELTGGEPGFAGFEDEQDGLVAKAAEPGVEYNAEA